MHLFFLLCGIVFIPQAHSLKCNKTICGTDDTTCMTKEEPCDAGSTRCGAIRNLLYDVNNTVVSDVLFRGCIKADTCKDASYSAGVFQQFYTTMCCDTDLCNAELVPPKPTRKPAPNGSKCYQCGGNPKCNTTVDCTGDETFCFIDTKGDSVYKGCATKSFCVNPPSIIKSHAFFMKCCDGDLCNRSSSSSITACIFLLTTMLMSLFVL